MNKKFLILKVVPVIIIILIVLIALFYHQSIWTIPGGIVIIYAWLKKASEWCYSFICQIDDLNPKYTLERGKSIIKILWIENDLGKYTQVANDLCKKGYKIKIIRDIKDIDIVKDYHIILCDIGGVGQMIGARDSDGNNLITSINDRYPLKFIAIVTGEEKGNKLANGKYPYYLKGHYSDPEFISSIDEWIKSYLKPKDFWNDLIYPIVKNYNESIINSVKKAYIRDLGTKYHYSQKEKTRIYKLKFIPELMTFNNELDSINDYILL